MNILVVDDHPIVRNGIIQLLTCHLPNAVFGEAWDGKDVLQKVSERHWDILLLDLNLPGKNGLELVEELSLIHPDLSILVLSMHPADQFGARALKAGASGYLPKESAPEVLIDAIHKVLASKSLGKKAIVPLSLKNQRDFDISLLSKREFTVLRLLYKGHPAKEVAAILGLSPKTISTYRQRILEKLGVQSNSELIQYVVRNALFD